LDANNNVLGTLVGLTMPSGLIPAGLTVYRNGYFVNLYFSGQFPAAFGSMTSAFILWTGSNCSGNGYLIAGGGSQTTSRIVVYSVANNSLYVPSGSGVVTAITYPVYSSFESYASCFSTNGSGYSGYALTPFNAATLGWTLSGNPLSVAGPIKFQ